MSMVKSSSILNSQVARISLTFFRTITRCAFFLVIFAIAQSSLAQSDPDWRNIIVEFTIRSDGSLQVMEWSDVVVPELAQTMERKYWIDPGQWIEFTSVLRMVSERDAVEEKIETMTPGTVRWPATAGTHRYIIQSVVRGVVAPGWSIPRALRIRGAGPNNPLDRFRDALPIWTQSAQDRDHRFLLDYHYDMPPRSTTGTTITFSLYWPEGWAPVKEITADTIVIPHDGDGTIPDGYRVRHLFHVAKPPGGNLVHAHQIRIASILLFPLVGLIFWLVFVLRETMRRRMIEMPVVDDAFLRTKIYSEAPELIEAHWYGKAPHPTIEPFLRRLESQRKVGLTIDTIGAPDDDDHDVKVAIRLLVARDQLSPYERAGIDALIPKGHDTSSDDIQNRYRNQDFDPADALQEALDGIAAESRGPAGDWWPSRLLSFVLFWGGLALFILSMLEWPEPWAIFAPPVAAVVGSTMWPSSLIRDLLRRSILWFALNLVPLLLLFLLLVASHLLGSVPLSPWASIGLSIFFLAAYKAILSQSTGRESPEALQRTMELTAARRWLHAHPPTTGQYDPWLTALALPPRGGGSAVKEDWGWSLTSFSE